MTGGIGDPYVPPPTSAGGRSVQGEYELQPFEYFRTDPNGQRYVHNAVSDPFTAGQNNEPPPGAPPIPTPSPPMEGGSGRPPVMPGGTEAGRGNNQLMMMLQALFAGQQGQEQPYGPSGNIPNAYGGIGTFGPGPMSGEGIGQSDAVLPPRLSFPSDLRASGMGSMGQPGQYSPTLSGGIRRGGFNFWRGGRV